MRRRHRPWHGGRVLVAEDHYLLGEVTCEFLIHCGLEPVGPVATAAKGCRMARTIALDGAVLDLGLADDLCLPICRALHRRGIPFMFLTGYSDLSRIPPEFREAPLVCKPFATPEMLAALSLMLDRDVALGAASRPALMEWEL